MTLPLGGPFYERAKLLYPPPNPSGLDYWFKNRTIYRQAPPYDHPLKYSYSEGMSTFSGYVDSHKVSAGNVMAAYGWPTWVINVAKSRAWDRFVDAATETASLGETLAEMQSSGAMVLQRIGQFAAFVHHLRWHEWGKAADALGIPRKKARDVWSKDRTIATNVMEVQYGWRPLIRDMYNAMEVLTRDLKDREIRARGNFIGSTFEPKTGPWSKQTLTSWRARVQYAAKISVSNPNLALLSALGLTNPLGTLSALVPYSFVLDWFTNYQQALAGYNRFMGLTITDPYTTIGVETSQVQSWPYYGSIAATDGYRLERTLDLKLPSFYVKPFVGWSPERALNAISLLVLQLPKRGEDRVARASRPAALPFNWDTGRKVPKWKVP